LNVRQGDTTISSMKSTQKSLSPLDQEIMDIVWNCKTCSVREVLEQIQKEKELAYTTVATILTRLNDKGLLKRTEKNSVVYYSPKISREDFSKKVVGSFFSNFFQSFGDTAIASFAESIEELPKEKKDYFLKLLEKHNETT
jgi:predicted transcriptional regulator